MQVRAPSANSLNPGMVSSVSPSSREWDGRETATPAALSTDSGGSQRPSTPGTVSLSSTDKNMRIARKPRSEQIVCSVFHLTGRTQTTLTSSKFWHPLLAFGVDYRECRSVISSDYYYFSHIFVCSSVFLLISIHHRRHGHTPGVVDDGVDSRVPAS